MQQWTHPTSRDVLPQRCVAALSKHMSYFGTNKDAVWKSVNMYFGDTTNGTVQDHWRYKTVLTWSHSSSGTRTKLQQHKSARRHTNTNIVICVHTQTAIAENVQFKSENRGTLLAVLFAIKTSASVDLGYPRHTHICLSQINKEGTTTQVTHSTQLLNHDNACSLHRHNSCHSRHFTAVFRL